MKQTEIQEFISTQKIDFGGSLFQNGQKKCRTCDIFYIPNFEKNYCLKCGKRLAIKAHKKHHRPSRYGY